MQKHLLLHYGVFTSIESSIYDQPFKGNCIADVPPPSVKMSLYLTARGLLEAPAQHVLRGDRLVLRNLVSMLAGVEHVVAVMLDLLAAVCVVVGVAGGRRRGARLGALDLMSVVVVAV